MSVEEIYRLDQEARALYARQEYRQALDIYNRIKRAAPHEVNCRLMLAETLRVLGRRKAALEELGELMALAPNNAYVHNATAQILGIEGDTRGQREFLRKAAEVAESAGDPALREHESAALAFSNKDYETALRHIEAARRMRPDDETLLSDQGIALLRLGRDEEAYDVLRRAVRVPFVYAGTLYYLGLVQERLGDTDGAIEAYWRALRVESSTLEAFRALLRIYRNQRRWGQFWRLAFWMLTRRQ